MPLAKLDHLVLATPDLAGTTAWISAAIGIDPTPGGQHRGRGTRNFLLSFGAGSYLEIIGPDAEQPEPVNPRPFGIDRLERPSLVTWVARAEEIERAVRLASEHGFDPGPIEEMSRHTPDGHDLRWRLAMRPLTGVSVFPFLIAWGDSRHPSTTAAPGASLSGFRATHPDPAAISRPLAALGLELAIEKGPAERLFADIAGPRGGLTVS